METKTAICIHEDRVNCLVGVKLTVLSIRKYHRDIPILLSVGNVSDSFRTWCDEQEGISLVAHSDKVASGFNVKPGLLMQTLDAGCQSAIWVDADIIFCGDILRSITNEPEDVLVGTEETYFGQHQEGTIRTEAWGFKAGRSLPCTMNTGIVRATARHRRLLEAWDKMLHLPLYQSIQQKPWYQRPLHLLSDQEVFTALLGSEEFSDVPIRFLKRGYEIAQCMGPAGFTPAERLRSFASRRVPAIIHSMGTKPWLRGLNPELSLNLQSLRTFYEFLHAELTPYSSASREYRHLLKEDTDWIDPVTRTSKLLSAFFNDNIVLKELPLSIFDSITRHARRMLGIARHKIPDEYRLAGDWLHGPSQL